MFETKPLIILNEIHIILMKKFGFFFSNLRVDRYFKFNFEEIVETF